MPEHTALYSGCHAARVATRRLRCRGIARLPPRRDQALHSVRRSIRFHNRPDVLTRVRVEHDPPRLLGATNCRDCAAQPRPILGDNDDRIDVFIRPAPSSHFFLRYRCASQRAYLITFLQKQRRSHAPGIRGSPVRMHNFRPSRCVSRHCTVLSTRDLLSKTRLRTRCDKSVLDCAMRIWFSTISDDERAS